MRRLLSFLLVALGAFVTPTPSASAPPAACTVTVFPRYGTYVRTPRLRGPGLLLDGGGALESPNSTLVWLHRRLLGNTRARGGNIIVLRAVDVNLYDKLFYKYGNFASIQTIRIPPCASAQQIDAVAPLVRKADAVYFAGGDQAHYVIWKGTALIAAVKRVYARGGVVGGGSAGLAIQGAVVYDSVAADKLDADTTTRDATRNPLEARISFTTGLFDWPPLADTIADTHLVVRDRLGRTVVFLARILEDGLLPGARTVYGLGIDQGSAVVVDPNGMATVLNAPGARGAYLVRAGTPPHLAPNTPIRYTVDLSHIAANGARFDLLHKRTQTPWYAVTVDGSKTPVYDADPYGR
jgi:cyanophycinase-like exopeptidase